MLSSTRNVEALEEEAGGFSKQSTIARKQMKRIFHLFIVFSLLFSLIGATSCSLFYTVTDKDNVVIGYSKTNAFIGPVEYVPNDDKYIELPDEYDGRPVTELGGYFGRGVPTPFCIEYRPENREGQYFSTTESADGDFSWLGEYEMHDIYVTVSLPKHLKAVTYACKNVLGIETTKPDGSTFTELYRVRCFFVIDESNRYFYTVDGKLYDKKTKESIDDFIYF